MNDTAENSEAAQVDCPPTWDTAIRWFIFAAMMIGFGAYTVWEHYIQGDYPYPEPYELNPYLTYLFNHYNPYVLIPLGVFALVMGIRHRVRKLVADEAGIRYGRTHVAWSEVTELDASQLKEKNILCVLYGGSKRLKLASYNLENFRELVAFVESNVSQEATVR